MTRSHALKLAKVLMMKTTANGCTVAEASQSAAKLTEFMATHKITLREIMAGDEDVAPTPRPTPTPQPTPPRPAPPADPAWKQWAGIGLIAFMLIKLFVLLIHGSFGG